MINIQHPTKTIIPLAVGLAWGNDGALYFEKLDGEFAEELVDRGGEDIAFERMA